MRGKIAIALAAAALCLPGIREARGSISALWANNGEDKVTRDERMGDSRESLRRP